MADDADKVQRLTDAVSRLGVTCDNQAESISRVTGAQDANVVASLEMKKASDAATRAEEHRRDVLLSAQAKMAGMSAYSVKQQLLAAKIVREAAVAESATKVKNVAMAKAVAAANIEESITMAKMGKATRSVTEGGGAFAASMDIMATVFPKAAKFQEDNNNRQRKAVDALSSFNSGLGSYASKMAALGPIIAIGSFLMNAAWAVLKGGVDVNRAFLGSVIRSNDGIRSSAYVFSQMSYAAKKFGATSDEAMEGVTAVSKGYAINTLKLDQFKDAQSTYLADVVSAIGETVGYGKAIGLSADQTGAFSNALGVMGADLRNLPALFKAQIAVGKAAGLNIDDYTARMVETASANMLSTDALSGTNRVLLAFAGALRITNDEVLKGIHAQGRAAAVASATNSFIKAANNMDTGMKLAVAQSRNPGGSLTALIQEAAQPKGGNLQQLSGMMGLVATAAGGSRDDQVNALTFFSEGMIGKFADSNIISKLVLETLKNKDNSIIAGQRVADQASKDQLAHLGSLAKDSALIKDPLQYIAGLLEGILGLVGGGLIGMGTGSFGSVGARAGSTPARP